MAHLPHHNPCLTCLAFRAPARRAVRAAFYGMLGGLLPGPEGRLPPVPVSGLGLSRGHRHHAGRELPRGPGPRSVPGPPPPPPRSAAVRAVVSHPARSSRAAHPPELPRCTAANIQPCSIYLAIPGGRPLKADRRLLPGQPAAISDKLRTERTPDKGLNWLRLQLSEMKVKDLRENNEEEARNESIVARNDVPTPTCEIIG